MLAKILASIALGLLGIAISSTSLAGGDIIRHSEMNCLFFNNGQFVHKQPCVGDTGFGGTFSTSYHYAYIRSPFNQALPQKKMTPFMRSGFFEQYTPKDREWEQYANEIEERSKNENLTPLGTAKLRLRHDTSFVLDLQNNVVNDENGEPMGISESFINEMPATIHYRLAGSLRKLNKAQLVQYKQQKRLGDSEIASPYICFSPNVSPKLEVCVNKAFSY